MRNRSSYKWLEKKTNFTFNNKGFKQEFEGCLYKILISSFVYEFVENMLNFKESETLHKMQKAGLAAWGIWRKKFSQ